MTISPAQYDTWVSEYKEIPTRMEKVLARDLLKALVAEHHIGYYGDKGQKIENNGYAFFDVIICEYMQFRYYLCSLAADKSFVNVFSSYYHELLLHFFDDFYHINTSLMLELLDNRTKRYDDIILQYNKQNKNPFERFPEELWLFLNNDFANDPLCKQVIVGSVFEQVEVTQSIVAYKQLVWKRLNVILNNLDKSLHEAKNKSINNQKKYPDINNKEYMQELCEKYHVFAVEQASLEGVTLYVILGLSIAFIMLMLLTSM